MNAVKWVVELVLVLVGLPYVFLDFGSDDED